MLNHNILDICHKIYKKTLAYELEKAYVDEQNYLVIEHSDRYMDEHPNANKYISKRKKDE